MASERPPARSMKDPNEHGNTKARWVSGTKKKLKKRQSQAKNSRNHNDQSLIYIDMSGYLLYTFSH